MQTDKSKKTAAGIERKRAGRDGQPDILIIEGRFYDEINDELLKGATTALKEVGCGYELITVPGALEIPVAMAMAIEEGVVAPALSPFAGVVALGCVIRGETSHYDIVANQSAEGILRLAMDYAVPLGNGILTTDTLEQAQVRAASNGYNKGGAAVRACLALVAHSNDFMSREIDDLDEDLS